MIYDKFYLPWNLDFRGRVYPVINHIEMKSIKRHTVNKLGLEMIRQELLSKCKPSVFDGWLDDDLIDSKESQEMLNAWASTIEDDLDSSNAYFVQIDSHLTKSGHFEHISIDDSGIDVSFEEVA